MERPFKTDKVAQLITWASFIGVPIQVKANTLDQELLMKRIAEKREQQRKEMIVTRGRSTSV